VPGCDPQVYRSCAPAGCMADSDCGEGMVCYERSQGTCSVAPSEPCSSGQFCPPTPEPVCTESIDHICVPRYLLPCEQASDCGEGFTCEPQSRCGCSGSTPSTTPPPVNPSTPAPPPPDKDAGQADPEAADRGFAPAPSPPADCGCEPTGEKYCKVIEVACRADADCPKSFTCRQEKYDAPPQPACAVPAGQGDAGICGAALRPAPPPDVYRCIPPYADVNVGGVGVDEKGDSAGYPSSGPVPMPTTPGGNPVGHGGDLPNMPPPTAQPQPGSADAGVQGAPTGADPGPRHVRACAVTQPGSSENGGHAWSLWAALLTLSAAWAYGARRRR
jgi:hypothetical protein